MPTRRASARIGGTGLGLAISLEDATLHSGWLQVWSSPGAGSCFRLTLPARAGREITVSPLAAPAGRRRSDRPCRAAAAAGDRSSAARPRREASRASRTARASSFAARASAALAALRRWRRSPACASIPDSGPVRQGGPSRRSTIRSTSTSTRRRRRRARRQQRIVQGFIDAASSPKNNFQIAREYLTHSMAANWNPDESVTVDDGRQPQLRRRRASLWRVDVTPVANVDARRRRTTRSAARLPSACSYQLVRENGEWRISVAPDGVVIDDPTFRAVYAQQTLYFYSPDFSSLVPDARWFPARVGHRPRRGWPAPCSRAGASGSPAR